MLTDSLNGLVLVTYLALLLSVLSLWLPLHSVWLAPLLVAIAAGYWSGVLTGPAVIPIALLAGLCWFYRSRRLSESNSGVARWLVPILILIVALLLGLGALPGFHKPVVFDRIILSASAAPYTLRLNFDKVVAGLLILGLVYQQMIVRLKDWGDAFRRSGFVIVANTIVVIALAWVLGFVRPDLKWTPVFLIWAVVNLLFTVMSEEAFFRGFIQKELQTRLRSWRYGQVIAVGVSGVLFGAAHFAGGVTYVLLSTVAGIGYAIAFQRSGRIEMAMLAHFLLNAVHFLAFTYPRIA